MKDLDQDYVAYMNRHFCVDINNILVNVQVIKNAQWK